MSIHTAVIDGLRLSGWSESEISRFIEYNPAVFVQALQLANHSLFEAISHIEMFVDTDPELS